MIRRLAPPQQLGSKYAADTTYRYFMKVSDEYVLYSVTYTFLLA